MSVSDILLLYRARLRVRAVLVQELFAILGISIGVALLFASQVASTSLTHSVAQLTNQVVGGAQFQLAARGPGGVDEHLLKQVRRLAGVRGALPVLEVQANLITPAGRRSVDLLGVDPGFAHQRGPLLRHFSSAQLERVRAIALPAPLACAIGARPHEPLELQVGSSVLQTHVGARLQESDIGGLVHSPVAIAPVAYVQRVAGMRGKISRIFVKLRPGGAATARPGLARLAAAAGVNLEPGNFDSRLFAVAAAPENQGEVLFSAISAIVGFMFALNAMLVTVPGRRKLIKDVRAQGATRLMTLQILLFDAAVLGALACVVGLGLGELLSVAVFHAKPGYLASAFPVGDDRVVTWQSVTLAAGAGLAAAVAGVLWPLRGILGRPLQAEPAPRQRHLFFLAARLGAGFACLGVTTVIVLARAQDAVLGNLTLVVALVCLLPLLFDGIIRAFERVQRLGNGAATVLAVTELQTPQTRVRSLAIAATAAVAVFGIVAIQGAQANLQRGLDNSARGIDSSANVWVTPGGEASVLATVPFRQIRARALARLPGVGALGFYRGSFLDWGMRRLWVLAPAASATQPIPPGQLLSGSLALAAARVHAGGWVVVSQALASERHLRVGEAFSLPAPRPIRLRVAALSTNLGWPPGAIIMNSGDYARAWASDEPSAYQIQLAPGASALSVRRSIQRALGSQTGLSVEGSSERERRHYALARQGLSRLTQIRLLVLIAAVLAVAGAMGSMIWQRRDLVAFIKRQGYSRGVLWRWLLCESALLLGAGCSIGAVFGLYGQLLISHALASVTGFPVVFNVGALTALSSFALVSLIAMAVVALAGFLVVRVPPRTLGPAY